MLWYGYIYYTASVFLLLINFLFIFKLSNLYQTVVTRWSTKFSTTVLNTFMVFCSISFLTLYSLFDHYSNFFEFNSILETSNLVVYSAQISPSNCLNFFELNVDYIGVYTFPFVFIFIFVTAISILFCLSYNFNEFTSFLAYCVLISISGYTLFYTNSLILFFLAYETLLIPSFFILYGFAKTRRCIEASYLMFFWTQFGALFLILGFLFIFSTCETSSFSGLSTYNFNTFELNFLFMCLLIGFGVKLPIWPFYGWLPKAHVEASTNFSIFLSGVLVKFAFFGFFKCLMVIHLEPTFYFVYPFLFIGIVDAVFKLFYQIDLKKLVAYSTVVEMHWLTICIISGQSCLMLASFCMLISHALLSTNSFLLVDAIGRRFKTRLVTEISGLNFLCPKLFIVTLLNLLIFLGFPGSIMFISEILFFSFFLDLFPLMALVLTILLYLLAPTFFFKTWMNAIFGNSTAFKKNIPADLTSKELLLYGSLLFIMFWLGLSWQAFIF